MIHFREWAELREQNQPQPQQPFDRSVLRNFYSRMTTPTDQGHPLRAGGAFFNAQPEELQHFQQMVEHTKQRLIQELNGPLSQAWRLYKQWEDKNKSIMMRGREGTLCSLIKNGGPGTPVQEGTKDQSGYSYITVPTELYNALFWRECVKDSEQAIQSKDFRVIRNLLPKFAHFYKQ